MIKLGFWRYFDKYIFRLTKKRKVKKKNPRKNRLKKKNWMTNRRNINTKRKIRIRKGKSGIQNVIRNQKNSQILPTNLEK